jgi:hypothetical protein
VGSLDVNTRANPVASESKFRPSMRALISSKYGGKTLVGKVGLPGVAWFADPAAQ